MEPSLNAQEQWEVAAEDARKKAHELSQARIDDEARTLEFMAARLRSTKHEQRVKQVREEEERMEREALSVGDGKVGGYSFLRPDKSVDLNLCGVACAKVNDAIVRLKIMLVWMLKLLGCLVCAPLLRILCSIHALVLQLSRKCSFES